MADAFCLRVALRSFTIFPRSAPRKTATFVSFCCCRKIMERGSSVPWQETLREAIGDDKLDASALREYFRPLEDWLRTENLRTGDIVGWSYGKKLTCRCSALYLRYRLFVSDTFVLSLLDYFKSQIEQLRFTRTNLIPNIYLWNPNFDSWPFTWHGQSTYHDSNSVRCLHFSSTTTPTNPFTILFRSTIRAS